MNASTGAAAARVRAVVDRALQVLAVSVALGMLVTALHDVSQAWDSGYYHLPFAARLAGILPPESFVFHPANAARFEGFPLLGERIQGVLWRVAGRPEAANLLAFAGVPLFAWFARRRFGAAPWLTVTALFAVPLVHTHASSAYVDLPANLALAVAVLLALRAFASQEPVSPRTLVGAGVASAVAANMKALLHPLVALAIAALVARALPGLVRELRAPARRRTAALTLAVIALALPVVFATPLANLLRHGNPYYPVRMSLLGHALPGTEDAYASSPPWLASVPRPVRFVCSLLEIGIRPMTDEHRWTVDQWMPDESMGNRMGGFFGAYVVANVAFLVWRARADRSREVKAAWIGFLVFTAAVSVMPQSHELRYYLGWMIVLVSVNGWIASLPGRSPDLARGAGVVAALALAAVVAVTRADYVLPSGSRFEELLAAKVDPKVLGGALDGERICVQREPWNLLWAAPFHPPRRYVVVEAEEASDCGGVRLVK